jgi:hypothetical protein
VAQGVAKLRCVSKGASQASHVPFRIEERFELQSPYHFITYVNSLFLCRKLTILSDEATPSDRQLLKSTYSIRTVIDLRTKTEHIQALKKHKATQEARLSHVRSNDAVAEPLKIDGVRNLEIRLTGRAFEKHLTSQLSWSSYLKLAFLYIVGYRTEAISIIGREVMQPRGLVGLAVDTLDCSGAEIKEVRHIVMSRKVRLRLLT